MQRFRILLGIALVLGLVASAGLAAEIPFDFKLGEEGITSASVYTSGGRLVRVLWSLKRLPAGKQTARWDDLDELGRNVPQAVGQIGPSPRSTPAYPAESYPGIGDDDVARLSQVDSPHDPECHIACGWPPAPRSASRCLFSTP